MGLSGLYGQNVHRDETEVVIHHREVAGALMRVPTYLLRPTDRRWPVGVEPWMDGSGHPIPGRAPPSRGT